MRHAVVVVALVAATALTAAAPAGAGTFTQRTYAGDAGSRPYWLYVPDGLTDRRVPLVVMLHGCSQDGPDFAAGTRMNALADRDGFVVAYPEQLSAENTLGCWNWFERTDQERGTGEPAIIAGIAREVMREHRIDARRVHVAGLSAGGAMATIMGATYPDLFASIGVSAGLEYRAAEDLPSGLAAQQFGGPDPDEQGRLAVAASGGRARPLPAIVFHGDSDATVSPVNGEQVVAQWAQVADLTDGGDDDESVDADPDSTETVAQPDRRPATRSLHFGSGGRTIVESWVIHGMTHAWSGGGADGSYTDPAGPDASEEILRFFAANPRPTAAQRARLRLRRRCVDGPRLRVRVDGDGELVRSVTLRLGRRTVRTARRLPLVHLIGPRRLARTRASRVRAVVELEARSRSVVLRRSLRRCGA